MKRTGEGGGGGGLLGKSPFENTKKLPFAQSPEICLLTIMFWSIASRGKGKVSFLSATSKI